MSSVSSRNSLSPFNSYTKGCTRGICSLYCPQFCHNMLPPPLPTRDESSAPLSPLIIALIASLITAFLLLTYYTVTSDFCERARCFLGGDQDDNNHNRNQIDQHPEAVNHENHENRDEDASGSVGSKGLDKALIRSMSVRRYSKGDGFVDGRVCCVCLSEFRENECLRVLPNCNHAFHVECIDEWFKARNNCPLCRSSMASFNSKKLLPPLGITLPVLAGSEPRNSPESHLRVHRPSEGLVIVVEDLEKNRREEIIVVSFVVPRIAISKTKNTIGEENEEGKGSENAIDVTVIKDKEEGASDSNPGAP